MSRAPDPTQPLLGRRVAIIGAGLAGLVAANSLAELGARCSVYEAADQVGGRVRSLVAPPGSTDTGQRCAEVLEAGALRIHPHMVTMDLVADLGLPLEAVIARNDDARVELSDPNATVLPLRDWWEDVRIACTSSAARAAHPQLIGAEHSAFDSRRSLEELRDVGDPIRPARVGTPRSPHDLLEGRAPRGVLSDLATLKSTTQAHVVGGNQRIAEGLAARLDHVRLDCPISGVVTKVDHVEVSSPRWARARTHDYAVIATPPHLAADLDGNLSDETRSALRTPEPRGAVKIFVTYETRWWQQRCGILGGTSYPATGLIDRLLYPSWGWHDQAGTITTYSLKDNADRLDRFTATDRAREAVEAIARLHPEASEARRPRTISDISWRAVPFVRGAWVNWPDYDNPHWHLLRSPRGRILFAGDWLHPLTAWMAGAIESGRRCAADIVHIERKASL